MAKSKYQNKQSVSRENKFDRNPRVITKKQFTLLKDHLETLGDLSGVVFCHNHQCYVGGNQRSEVFDGAEIEIVERYDEPTEKHTLAYGFIKHNGEKYAYREVAFSDYDFRMACIVANNDGGENDFELLANEWDAIELEEWGMYIPQPDEDISDQVDQDQEEDEEPEKVEWVPDCLFASDNQFDIPVLKMSKENVYLHLPLKPYGADARTKTGVGTYHFYVDDYRFNAIWNDPTKIINSGVQAIVEPNCSLYETTPIGYGIFLIYKKRWIARMLQDFGIDVFVDLNVTEKFQKYNVMGVPKGYNAFFTRGYDNRMQALEQELQIAKDISGLENPNFCVYGGSKKIKDFCNKHSLTYVENSKLDL